MHPTVLITGATSGIGLALARRYHAGGARLVLVGRRPLAALEDPLFTTETYCQADLAAPEAAGRVAAHLEARAIDTLDLVFQNAAVGAYGPIEAETAEQIAGQVAVNLAAPIALTQRLAPWLERAGGKVVFVSSVVEALPCADFAVYAATKAALDGFARSLRVEWAGRIEVQVVHPGAVRTDFHRKASVPAELVASPRIPSADDVAGDLVRLAGRRARTPTLGVGNRVARFVGRRLGRPLDWMMRRRRA